MMVVNIFEAIDWNFWGLRLRQPFGEMQLCYDFCINSYVPVRTRKFISIADLVHHVFTSTSTKRREVHKSRHSRFMDYYTSYSNTHNTWKVEYGRAYKAFRDKSCEEHARSRKTLAAKNSLKWVIRVAESHEFYARNAACRPVVVVYYINES